MKKWLLSHDPDIPTHPWTLVQIEGSELTTNPSVRIVQVVQMQSLAKSIDLLINPYKIEQSVVL